jgi:hypothetical protein
VVSVFELLQPHVHAGERCGAEHCPPPVRRGRAGRTVPAITAVTLGISADGQIRDGALVAELAGDVLTGWPKGTRSAKVDHE